MTDAVSKLEALSGVSELDEAAFAALTALAEQMAREGAGRDDPMREIFGALGDRWSMLILLALKISAWRYATLRRVLSTLSSEGAISQRVLTLKLRALERDGLILRHASQDVPPRVSYELSALGLSLMAEIERVMAWVRANRAAIDAARSVFTRDRD